MSSRALWGELEPDECEDMLFQNVDFSQMIELTMHQIPDIPMTTKPTVVKFPTDDIVRHTIDLHEHARQLSVIMEQTENALAEGTPVEPSNLPPLPAASPVKKQFREIQTAVNFIGKELTQFSLGKGPVVVPLKPEEHQRALRQCASLALAHLGVHASTQTTVNVLADALDHHLWTMMQVMRTVADREADALPSGFPDVVCRTFAEMRISNLQEFYHNRFVQYRSKVHSECTAMADWIQETVQVPARQFKLEEVPELHFPAALSEVLTPSLEPGFQMLHSLEQEELQGLELPDAPQDDNKIEVVEYTQHSASAPDLASPSLSPRNKKKRK